MYSGGEAHPSTRLSAIVSGIRIADSIEKPEKNVQKLYKKTLIQVSCNSNIYSTGDRQLNLLRWYAPMRLLYVISMLVIILNLLN